jgi:hypothetical protein
VGPHTSSYAAVLTSTNVLAFAGIVKGGIRRLVYATPVDHAGHPIGYDVWDDLELWERALKKRQVWELFDPSRHSQPDFNLGVGNPARCVPQRAHSTRQLQRAFARKSLSLTH